jgi:hypothetical protein
MIGPLRWRSQYGEGSFTSTEHSASFTFGRFRMGLLLLSVRGGPGSIVREVKSINRLINLSPHNGDAEDVLKFAMRNPMKMNGPLRRWRTWSRYLSLALGYVTALMQAISHASAALKQGLVSEPNGFADRHEPLDSVFEVDVVPSVAAFDWILQGRNGRGHRRRST